MKYSIIIPYRNREEHLQIMLPRLQEVFEKESYEIIVSEQNDDDNFRISCVENVGFLHSKGDIITIHMYSDKGPKVLFGTFEYDAIFTLDWTKTASSRWSVSGCITKGYLRDITIQMVRDMKLNLIL
jgi:hypothetical protein